MTELDLYKFIEDNNIEYHTQYDPTNQYTIYNVFEIWMFVPFHLLEEFNKLLGHNISDNEGMDVVYKNGYLCFNMVYICEYFDIEPKNIFKL